MITCLIQYTSVFISTDEVPEHSKYNTILIRHRNISSVTHRINGQFENKLKAQIKNICQFNLLVDLAKNIGIDSIYLYGNSAATLSHYIHNDFLRENNVDIFQQERFSYHYMDIFSSKHPLQIAVDATPEKIIQLEKQINEHLPFFRADNDSWQITSLKKSSSGRYYLMASDGIKKFHSNSYSEGLIDLNKGKISDLQSLNKKETSQFLKDIKKRTITFNKKVKTRPNHPIISVIMFLTTAFKYNLTIKKADMVVIQNIIVNLNTSSLMKRSKVLSWINSNTSRLVTESINVEYSFETLRKLGLREKLISLSDSMEVKSMGWWLSKDPLKSFTIGRGKGKTADELGITLLTHTTRDLTSYEHILSDPSGHPNAFVSRNAKGENASLGDGFYTYVGKKSDRTGEMIPLSLHPSAREGKDFKTVRGGGTVLILNRNAIVAVPPTYNVKIIDYFNNINELMYNTRDTAKKLLQEKLKIQSYTLSLEDQNILVSRVSGLMDKTHFTYEDKYILKEYFKLPFSQNYPRVMHQLIKRGNVEEILEIAIPAIGQTGWINNEDLINQVVNIRDRKLDDGVIEYILGKRYMPKVMSTLISRENYSTLMSLAIDIFSNPKAPVSTELVKMLIDTNDINVLLILSKAFSKNHWKDHPGVVEYLITKGRIEREIKENLLETTNWKKSSYYSYFYDLLDVPVNERAHYISSMSPITSKPNQNCVLELHIIRKRQK